MIDQTHKRNVLCTVALAANLLFIWGNSLLPGEASAALSQFVKDILSMFLPEGPAEDSGDGLLRKLAHFAEFACLGWLLSCMTGMHLKTILRSVTLSLVCGFTAACIDEALQHLSPGRAPRFTDVLIDTAGVAVGIGILWLGYRISKRKKQKFFGGK